MPIAWDVESRRDGFERTAITFIPPARHSAHKMMLDHYQQTKHLLVTYSPKALGLLQATSAQRVVLTIASDEPRSGPHPW